jgi:hypothetical protein
MNHRHVFIVGGAFSALLLLYCLSFGPLVYLWSKVDDRGLMPKWLDDTLTVVFHPHVRLMYHSESYFDYVLWFSMQAGDINTDFTWSDFRDAQDGKFSRFD